MNRLAALRRRFIVVVMATITVMLLFIVLVIIAGNVQHYKNVAFESLHSLINFTNPVNNIKCIRIDIVHTVNEIQKFFVGIS